MIDKDDMPATGKTEDRDIPSDKGSDQIKKRLDRGEQKEQVKSKRKSRTKP